MRTSNDQYVNGALMNGYDYQLQVWVQDGICDDVGLNSFRYKGKPWLQARLELLGQKTHLLCLHEELSSRGLGHQFTARTLPNTNPPGPEHS